MKFKKIKKSHIFVVVSIISLLTYSYLVILTSQSSITPTLTSYAAQRSKNPSILGARRYPYRYGTSSTPSPTFSQSITPTVSQSPTQLPKSSTTIPNQSSTTPMIANLDKSSSKELQKLYEYQVVVNSFVTNKVMYFTNMPLDQNANDLASDVAAQLKEFDRYGITPIVIVEPTTNSGDLDPQSYINGNYDNANNTFLNKLKSLGITDKQLGIWTPFPEINIPEWNGTNYSPETYTAAINKYLNKLRSIYPNAKTSLLLDSTTLDSWNNENYLTDHKSLVPYVQNIQKGLVNYFCLQGYAWIPPKDSTDTPSLNPSEYLNINQAKEAADSLGIKNIWFNTGTPKSMFTNSPSTTSTLAPDKRNDILTQIVNQTSDLKNKGYDAWIMLFSEDKSKTDEAVDWSYWSNYLSTTDPNITVFKNFYNLSVQKKVSIAIYDYKK